MTRGVFAENGATLGVMEKQAMTSEQATSEPGITAEGLQACENRFVRTWGEMGSSWGIPRTMAEVHALLYIVGEAMNTDQVMDRLSVSRGSASMSLRALMDWGLVHRVHVRGDRKEYFKADLDVWNMFRIILRERKRREIDPVLMALHECRDLVTGVEEATTGDRTDVEALSARVDSMIEFVGLVDSLASRFVTPAGPGLRLAAGLLGKVV